MRSNCAAKTVEGTSSRVAHLDSLLRQKLTRRLKPLYRADFRRLQVSTWFDNCHVDLHQAANSRKRLKTPLKWREVAVALHATLRNCAARSQLARFKVKHMFHCCAAERAHSTGNWTDMGAQTEMTHVECAGHRIPDLNLLEQPVSPRRAIAQVNSVPYTPLKSRAPSFPLFSAERVGNLNTQPVPLRGASNPATGDYAEVGT